MSGAGDSGKKAQVPGGEFVAVLVVTAVVGLLLFDSLPRYLVSRELSICQANLKRIGEAFRLYANEDDTGRYPAVKLFDCEGAIQPWSGAVDLSGVVPEYLASADVFTCPAYLDGAGAEALWDEGATTNPRWAAVEGFSDNGQVEPCEVLARPYYYYGWALAADTFSSSVRYEPLEPEDHPDQYLKFRGLATTVEFNSFVHYKRFRAAVKSYGDNLAAHGKAVVETRSWELRYPNGKALELPVGSSIPALREGAERFFITDIGNPAASYGAQALVLVLHEEVFGEPGDFYHGDGRFNILYMDGHVETRVRGAHPWRERFPLNEAGLILHEAVDGV